MLTQDTLKIEYRSGEKRAHDIPTFLKQNYAFLNADYIPTLLFFHQSLLLFKFGNNHSNEYSSKESKDIYISQAVTEIQEQIRTTVLALKKLIFY